jgi:hypothetical protein
VTFTGEDNHFDKLEALCNLATHSNSDSCRKDLLLIWLGSKNLAEREGFEPAYKRKFYNMQGHGWQESS